MAISKEEFDLFRGYIKDKSGITLNYGKEYLVENRLSVLMAQNGCDTLKDLYDKISGNNDQLGKKVIDAMTTNETLWFRDATFVEAMEGKVVPWLLEKARTKTVRIWSAASSTGQEAYSLSMLIDDALQKAGSKAPPASRFQIIGTDISPSVIFMAVAGRYSQLAVSRGMRPEFLTKYFKKDGVVYTIDEKLRKMVSFKQLNLTETFLTMGKFDLILCRYVLIYFDEELKLKICGKFHRAMQPESLLAIGATESIRNAHDFTRIMTGRSTLYYPLSNDSDKFNGF
ncbi:MAG: CheR family methyltransferase [Thermodesulfobacteriota bacterium]